MDIRCPTFCVTRLIPCILPYIKIASPRRSRFVNITCVLTKHSNIASSDVTLGEPEKVFRQMLWIK